MESSRLPRFERASAIVPMQVTERDRTILRLVHEHRFLRSSHICSLIPGSSQQLLRRLQLLYHHGYLERPRVQLDYYHSGGSQKMVYGLADRGAKLLKEEGVVIQKEKWTEKNGKAGRIFLEHALLVSDVMVAIELACRNTPGVTFVREQRLFLKSVRADKSRAFRWKVKVGNRRLGVIPDGVFALEFKQPNGENESVFFFLEADRGTMPVERKNLTQTSFYRKMLAYEATWSTSLHTRRFGYNRFRVLTVTTIPERLNSLVNSCMKLRKGKGLFLFAASLSLSTPFDLFTPIWKSCIHIQQTRLLG
jgi:hypothetical protein